MHKIYDENIKKSNWYHDHEELNSPLKLYRPPSPKRYQYLFYYFYYYNNQYKLLKLFVRKKGINKYDFFLFIKFDIYLCNLKFLNK